MPELGAPTVQIVRPQETSQRPGVITDMLRLVIVMVVDVPLMVFVCLVLCAVLMLIAFVAVMLLSHGYPSSRVPS